MSSDCLNSVAKYFCNLSCTWLVLERFDFSPLCCDEGNGSNIAMNCFIQKTDPFEHGNREGIKNYNLLRFILGIKSYIFKSIHSPNEVDSHHYHIYSFSMMCSYSFGLGAIDLHYCFYIVYSPLFMLWWLSGFWQWNCWSYCASLLSSSGKVVYLATSKEREEVRLWGLRQCSWWKKIL